MDKLMPASAKIRKIDRKRQFKVRHGTWQGTLGERQEVGSEEDPPERLFSPPQSYPMSHPRSNHTLTNQQRVDNNDECDFMTS